MSSMNEQIKKLQDGLVVTLLQHLLSHLWILGLGKGGSTWKPNKIILKDVFHTTQPT